MKCFFDKKVYTLYNFFIMNLTLRKWGNSIGLRLPNTLLKEIALQEGSEVEIKLVDREIRISKISKEDFLEKLCGEISDKNLHHEVDTGGIMGNEVW